MSSPFFSVVTISYNQSSFLRQAIESVLDQDFKDFEYIVHDPGSTDTSRLIISSYQDRLITSLDNDTGPADGLNRAFKYASGRYYVVLYSDDLLLPGALSYLHNWITRTDYKYSVYTGAALIIDESGNKQRVFYPDKITPNAAAFGQACLPHPSTAVEAKAFHAIGGFNPTNSSNWDGELFVDMILADYKFTRSNTPLSSYRVHASSITGSGRLYEKHKNYQSLMKEKVEAHYGLKLSRYSYFVEYIKRRVRNPQDLIQRLFFGPVYKRR